jgi:endonuclease/exonuclease/phosphatase family metal-dependent hydrolase
VLVLQEVDRRARRTRWIDETRAVARACGMQAVFAPARRLGRLGSYGNSLLVRGSIEEWSVVPLPRTGATEPRCALRASVEVGGATLAVVATHLSIRRPEVFDQLQAVAGMARECPRPAVVMGDLNLNPAEVEPALSAAGLTLAGGPPTFPAASPEVRIDHVAVSAGLRIASVSVPATPCSDHRPLVVEVEFDG